MILAKILLAIASASESERFPLQSQVYWDGAQSDGMAIFALKSRLSGGFFLCEFKHNFIPMHDGVGATPRTTAHSELVPHRCNL